MLYSTHFGKLRACLVTLLLLACTLSSFNLHAQNALAEELSSLQEEFIPAKPVNLFRQNKTSQLREEVQLRDADLTEFELLDLNTQVAEDLLADRPLAAKMTLPNPAGGAFNLELVRFDLLAADFEAVEMPSGRPIAKLPQGVFYRGILRGDQNSVVALSVIDGKVSGLISPSDQSGDFNLVALEKEGTYLLYDDAQIKSKFTDTDCEAVLPKGQEITRPTFEEIENAAQTKVDGCFGIYLDIGQQIYRERGNSSAAAISFLEGAMAQVAVLYANEQINITISGTAVWTNGEPFYNNLGAYKDYRAANNVNGSLAHYVHRAGGGGVAYLTQLCSGSYGYGMSGIDNSYRSVPNYSWTIYVIAHELGHNFGSEHTHDCAWNNNNTPIDGCGSRSNGCGISNFIPGDGGTIMSYCHLQSVGINFSKGFGSQPGDRIRYYAGRAACRNFSGCSNSNNGGNNGGGQTATCNLTFTNTGCNDVNVWTEEGGWQFYTTIAPGDSYSPSSEEGVRWQFWLDPNNKVGEYIANCSGSRSYNINSGGSGCNGPTTCTVSFTNTGCNDVNVWTEEGGWQFYTTIAPGDSYSPSSEEGVRWQFWLDSSNKVGEYTANCSGNRSYNINSGGSGCNAILADGLYVIYARHSNKAVAKKNGNTNNGALVAQTTFTGVGTQAWLLTHLGNDVYRIVNYGSNKAMSVYLGGQRNIHSWDYVNGANQKWKIESVGGGYFQLVATYSNQCLNVAYASQSDNAQIIQYPCTNSTNDDFSFVPASAGTLTSSTPEADDDAVLSAELSVYPNPTNGQATFAFTLDQQYEEGQILVRDLQGRIVKQFDFEAFKGQHEMRIDVSTLQSGIYITELSTEGLRLNKRLVVKR